MKRSIILLWLMISSQVSATLITYSGFLNDEVSVPVSNGYVIAGTFAPSFNPHNYKFEYGDSVGNLDTPNFSLAVSDGNFNPIGPGTFSDGTGFFSGSGTATGIVGQTLWIFGFAEPVPDDSHLFVLASSSDPSWTAAGDLPGDQNTLLSSQASTFVFGGSDGVALNLQVLPIPEPSVLGFFSIGIVATYLVRYSRRISGKTMT